MNKKTYTVVYDDVYSSTDLDFGEKIVLGKILHILRVGAKNGENEKPLADAFLMKCCGIDSTGISTFKRIKKRLAEKGYINYKIRYCKELNCNTTYYSVPSIEIKEPQLKIKIEKEKTNTKQIEFDKLPTKEQEECVSIFMNEFGRKPTTYDEINNYYKNKKYNEAV